MDAIQQVRLLTPCYEFGRNMGRHRHITIYRDNVMFEKMIGFIKHEDGASTVHNEHHQLTHVLKEEWRAIRTAQQDRAHLATVWHESSTQRNSL